MSDDICPRRRRALRGGSAAAGRGLTVVVTPVARAYETCLSQTVLTLAGACVAGACVAGACVEGTTPTAGWILFDSIILGIILDELFIVSIAG